MKKFILTISIILLMCGSVIAQGGNDAFINDWGGSRNGSIDPSLIVALPAWELFGTNENKEPLDSGLLILAVLGAGYAIKLKLDNQKQ